MVYDPQRECAGNSVSTALAGRYNAFIYFNKPAKLTTAVHRHSATPHCLKQFDVIRKKQRTMKAINMTFTLSQFLIGTVVFLASVSFQLAHAQCIDGTFEELPAHFSRNRIFVRPITLSGETLNLYTYTGGGLFLTSAVVERLGLPTEEITADGRTVTIATLPEFKESASIPVIPERPGAPPFRQGRRLPVFPDEAVRGNLFGDGILGQAWFATRVWVFNYPDQTLSFSASEGSLTQGSAHTVPAYFKTNEAGEHIGHWPRIQAQVSGEALDFLLDTGATLDLADGAYAALEHYGPQVRSTSYIISSIFKRWREQNPDWRVLEQADVQTDEPAIEVPQVTIAGHTVGPVWFTRRADENFTNSSSQYMDQPIVGAIGGSLFQYF